MKVAAFSIKQFEKELLDTMNTNRHSITYFPFPLSPGTAEQAAGCEAVLVFTNDDVSAPVIALLADLGIKYIATRSVGTDHIDKEEASKRGIRIANVPAYSPEAIAEHAVMLALALARKLIPTVDQSRRYDFTIENHMGFNLHKKTVGIVGLGHIGKATARIFKGFGCRVIGFDVCFPEDALGVEEKNFDQLLEESDIISLHVPLTPESRHMINEPCITKMKAGVMIINTARGALVDTEAAIPALENKKIGAFGLDVYEYEKGLFFADHQSDVNKDPLLAKLLDFENVIVTPHQAFLTKEAVTEIAASTLSNLNKWKAEGDDE